ncbi:MAG TPA: EamA family transporter, partial [Longimicrobiales bacterium]|nr:EamA family transporter [Longimicrobiales bacterium]
MTRRSVVERPAAGVADPVSKPLVIVAFAIVYIVWGSTYLAIRYAVETLPPLLMAGTRFLVAGGLLYAWLLLRGEAGAVGRREWRAAFVIGGLLLLGGNGFVVWAEQWVPSGVASLLVGTVPVWMVLFEWRRHGGDRPTSRVALGLALGFIGIAVLAGPGDWAGGAIHAPGAVALVLASILWAAGAIYSRSAP